MELELAKTKQGSTLNLYENGFCHYHYKWFHTLGMSGYAYRTWLVCYTQLYREAF